MKRAAVLLALVACRPSGPAPARPDAGAAAPPASVTAAPSASAAVETGDARLALVKAWSRDHDAHDAAALGPLYDDAVLFYGSPASRAQVTSGLVAFFATHPGFHQTIGDVTFSEDAGVLRASFVKTVTDKGKTTDYPSYLELARHGDRWAIAAESDTVTDAVRAKRCAKVAWTDSPPNDARGATFTGRIARADGFDAAMNVEHYLRLTLDQAACMPAGAGAQSSLTVQVFGADKGPNLEPFVGKHVRVQGDAFMAHTAHHHEPILMEVESVDAVR